MCGGGGGFLGDILNPVGAALREADAPRWVGDVQQYADDILNPQNRGGRIIGNIADNKVGGWEGLDQLVDIPKPGAASKGTDQGMVDYGFRKVGDYQPQWFKDTMSTLGTGIGGYLYGPGGAAAMAGLASKAQQGSDPNRRDYQAGFQNAGTAAAMVYAASAAGEALGGAGSAPSGSESSFQVDSSLAPTSDYTGGQYFNVDQSLAPTSDVAGGYGLDPSYAQGDYFNADTFLAPLDSPPPVPQTPEDVSFLQQIINNPKTTEIAKLLAKQALKMAVQYGTQGLMGNMQTFTPQQAPQINTNYSGIPTSQFANAGMISEPTSYTDPTWRPGVTDVNTAPTNPNYATDYSLQKQKEVENKRKMEDITKFNPDAYLANYYA